MGDFRDYSPELKFLYCHVEQDNIRLLKRDRSFSTYCFFSLFKRAFKMAASVMHACYQDQEKVSRSRNVYHYIQ